LRLLNYLLHGWCNFYRHASGAKRVFASLDTYVWWTIFRWLKRKHHPMGVKALFARYGWRPPDQRSSSWRDGRQFVYQLRKRRTEHFKLGWLKTPDFV
jgi:hypothetical protein